MIDKPSDAEILKVIEAYCALGKTRALICESSQYQQNNTLLNMATIIKYFAN